MELAIDTSTEFASLALSSAGKVETELTWHVGQNHTSELVPRIASLLSQAKVEVEHISAVAIARGPGSFNGLRVGMSVAKGLAFGLGIPIVGIGTLQVQAYPYAPSGLPICSILNAGRGEIAVAFFQCIEGRWTCLEEEHIARPEDLVSSVNEKTVFCGEIPYPAMSIIRHELGYKALIFTGAGFPRRAGSLAELGWLRLREGDHDRLSSLEPLYLRRPAITVSRRYGLGIMSSQQ